MKNMQGILTSTSIRYGAGVELQSDDFKVFKELAQPGLVCVYQRGMRIEK